MFDLKFSEMFLIQKRKVAIVIEQGEIIKEESKSEQRNPGNEKIKQWD